jgi:ABC-type glycerol-3-phosphate transport system permease component
MAGNMFVLVPMVLAFLVAQRHFIRGLTIGGVKG